MTPVSAARDRAANRCRFAAVALLALGLAATVLVYSPGMRAGFYFDDLPNIVEREALHWRQLSPEGIARSLTEAYLPRRPVANLSFALNHLFGGLEPAGYHWTNLGVHLAVGLLLVWLFVRLADSGRDTPVDPTLGFAVAVMMTVLFLLHPLNIQAVTYVVQRMTALAALFYLLAFAAYLEARRTSGRRRTLWMALAATGALLAAGSKENAWVLPLAIAVYEWGFHRAGWPSRSRSSLPRIIVPIVLVGVVLLMGWYAAGHGILYWHETLPGKDHTGWQRLLTQARVQWHYLGLLLWPAPSRLTLDYAFAPSRSLFDPATTAVAVTAWLALLAVAARWLWTRPRYGVPLVTYFLLHTVEAAPLNLETVYEHRMYLPMFAIAWLLTVGLVDLLTARPHGCRTVLVLTALLTVPLGAATYQRNQVWADPVAFHYDNAAKAPGKFRPQYNLATLLGPLGRYQEAARALERALALAPQDSLAHNQLANVYLLTGRRAEAMRHYELAVRYDPNNAEAVYNLARQLDVSGRRGRADALYRHFLTIQTPHLARERAWVVRRLGTAEAEPGSHQGAPAGGGPKR